MPLRAPSYGGSLEVATLPKYQLDKNVLVFLPDPTFGAGGSTTWSYEVTEMSTLTIKDSGTVNWPAQGNAIKIHLDPTKYSTGETYRVRIFNSLVALVDEWHFIPFDVAFSTVGPINTAVINEYVKRIAGLLGWNTVIEHDEVSMGVPGLTTITIYDGNPDDPGSSVIYQYSQRKIVDETHRVVGEISARVQ